MISIPSWLFLIATICVTYVICDLACFIYRSLNEFMQASLDKFTLRGEELSRLSIKICNVEADFYRYFDKQKIRIDCLHSAFSGLLGKVETEISKRKRKKK